jgi:hypothetical protein
MVYYGVLWCTVCTVCTVVYCGILWYTVLWCTMVYCGVFDKCVAWVCGGDIILVTGTTDLRGILRWMHNMGHRETTDLRGILRWR